MGWKEKVFCNFRLYAITDLCTDASALIRKIEQAYRGGADIIQLRSKALSDRAVIRLGLKIRKAAERYRKLFFLNDRVDLAMVIGADGVHLGQTDLPIPVARRLVRKAGKNLWIGKSTHSLAQAIQAEREKADYIGVGPVFATPTKPGTAPVGLELVRQVAHRVKIPWVVIGGIDCHNIHRVVRAGAARVAVVRAVFASNHPGQASQKLKTILEG